jgi:hypothetical protein
MGIYLHVSDGGKVLPAARSSLVVEFADPPPLLLMDILDMRLDISLLLEPLAAQGAGEGPLVVVSPLVRLLSNYLDMAKLDQASWRVGRGRRRIFPYSKTTHLQVSCLRHTNSALVASLSIR